MRERNSVGDRLFDGGATLSMMKAMKARLQETVKHYEALETKPKQPEPVTMTAQPEAETTHDEAAAPTSPDASARTARDNAIR